jgi:predicted flap endonuclease-1-like 5' DNA nuclease/predicted  nucleic acid-binding Zn-ribbon protein
MSISYIVSALVACGFTCIVGAYGMRVYFVRNREIADREDPRDTQIRDLQATLQNTRKDAVERKTSADDATKHLEFAHDRIKELLQSGKETTDKLDACKELLRNKIVEREQLHDKFITTERQANEVKERLEDLELELSMANESGNILESGLEGSAAGVSQPTAQGAATLSDSERTNLEEKLAAAQTELNSVGSKLSVAENDVTDLRSQLQDARSNQSLSEHSDARADVAPMSQDERKGFEEKISATQDRVFVAEGKLAAVQKESKEKLAAAQARLAAAEQEGQEKLAAAQESVSAAEASLVAAQEKADLAENKLTTAQERATAAENRLAVAQEGVSAAEAKLVAAQDRISATEGKLSTVQERIQAAEGQLSVAEREAEERLAAAQEKLISVERRAEDRIAAAKTKFFAVEKAAQDKLATAEVRLAATEKVAENRITSAQEKLSLAEEKANEKLAAAQEEVDTLKSRLQEVEQRLEEADQVSAHREEENTDESESAAEDDDEMYTSSVEDGSPSLIQCLNEELDRWKRHCHVLGDELKQQREQLEAELEAEEAPGEFADEISDGFDALPANDSEPEEVQFDAATSEGTEADEPQFEESDSEDPESDLPAEVNAEEASEAEPAASDTSQYEASESHEAKPEQEAEANEVPVTADQAEEHQLEAKPVWSSANRSEHGSDDPDELTEIRGIGKVLAGKLHELGIYRYEQLAALDEEDVDRVQGLIPDFERRMQRDNWLEQARSLHSSKYSE